MLDVLADNRNPESIVHGLVKEVTVKLDNIRVVLCFEKLNGFLLLASKA